MTQQRGRIKATLELSKVPFSKTLKEALAESVTTAAAIRKAFSEPLKLPTIPPVTLPPALPSPSRPRGNDPEAARQRTEIIGIANGVNALKVAYERGEVTQAQFVAGMRTAVTEAGKLRQGYAANTTEFGRLTNIIGVGARSLTTAEGQISRLGLSQQVALGSTRNLTSQFAELHGSVLPLIGVAGLGRLLTLTNNLATSANRVNVTQDILNLTLDRTGQSGESAQQAISGVAKELGVAEGQIVDYLTQLVRVGFTTEQANQALIAGGASALAYGKTAAQGIESVANALVTRSSVLLNQIGIAENIGAAMNAAADGAAKFGDEAANQAAAVAGLEIVLKATRSEVDSLDKLTGGLAGSQNEAATAAFNLRQEFGEMLIPLETLKNEALAGVLSGFRTLPGTAQAGAASFGAVTLGVGALATGLTALQPLLAATFLPPAGAVVLGVAVLAGMVSGLVALAQAARENVTPFKTISENVKVTQAAIGKASDKEALAGSLEALSTQLDGKAKQSVIRYAAEVRKATGDLSGLQKQAAGFVAQISLDDAIRQRSQLQQQLATVPKVQDADPDAIVRDLQDRLNRSAEVQALGIQFKLGVEQKDGQLAVKFLDDIQSRATLSAEAADLVSRSLAETNTQINQVGNGARQVIQAQINGLNKTIAELRSAGQGAAKPIPTPEVSGFYDDEAVKEAEERLREAQALREKIAASALDLERAQAEAADDPMKALRLRFMVNEREIVASTNRFIAEVQKQLDDGAIGQVEAIAQVDELQRQGFGRLTLNEKTYTDGVKTELDRRAEVIRAAQQNIAALRSSDTAADQRAGGDEAGALKTELDAELAVIRSGLQEQLQVEGQGEAQKQALRDEARARELSATNGYNRSLADLDKQRTETARQEAEASAQALSAATIANIDGGIPQLIASFAEERRVRREAFGKRLEESKADGSAQAGLITDFNRTELQLGFAHNREVKTQQETALKSYREAVKTHQRELKTAREEATRQEIANETALNQARQNSVNQRLEAARALPTNNLPEQVAANQALLTVLEDGVRVAQLATQAARDRKASAEEIVGLLGSEAQAQQAVTQAIQSNIDALKQQRGEAEAVIGTGGQLVSLMQDVNEITGGSLDRGEVLKGLEAEENALIRQLRLLESQDAGLDKIAEKTRQIAENQKAQNEAGGNAQLSGSEQRTVNRAAADAVAEFDSNVFSAEQKVRDLNEQIALSSAELVTATSKLTELLNAAASDEGLNLEVKVKVDRKGVDEAKKELRDVFGAEAGDRIIRQAEQAGAKGGKGLASAFASGLLNGRALIRNAVETVLREDVRAYLPSSDARKGPLSSLTKNGVSLVRTIGVGMMRERSGLSRISESIAAAARPALSAPAIPTSRPVYGSGGMGAAAPAGGPTIGALYVDGRQTSNPTGMLSLQAKQMAEIAVRELKF